MCGMGMYDDLFLKLYGTSYREGNIKAVRIG